jgi:hypothetical protein
MHSDVKTHKVKRKNGVSIKRKHKRKKKKGKVTCKTKKQFKFLMGSKVLKPSQKEKLKKEVESGKIKLKKDKPKQ